MPSPAKKVIPEWYRKQPRYIGGEKTVQNGRQNFTVKTCMPFLDTLTTGYILFTISDIFITEENGAPYYNWASHNFLSFHNFEQLSHYPDIEKEAGDVPKFMNPWIIRTPKNYSCLFLTPMNHDVPFMILPGIVDTDTYANSINFPFILKKEFRGLIPRGTPMAQVIPFKRDTWQMGTHLLSENSGMINEHEESNGFFASEFFDRYKRRNWRQKNYN